MHNITDHIKYMLSHESNSNKYQYFISAKGISSSLDICPETDNDFSGTDKHLM